MPGKHGRQRFKSIRSYRRWLENVMADCEAGRRRMSDASQAATAAKAAAELFMVEQMLVRHGRDVEFEHPLGEDGGLQVASGSLQTRAITLDQDGNEIAHDVDVAVPEPDDPEHVEETDPKAAWREMQDMW